MEDDSCVYFTSCLAARVRKAITIMTTAASLTGNIMTLFLLFKNSMAAPAMQSFFLLLVRDPPHFFIFCLVILLLLVVLAMAGPFTDDDRILVADTCGADTAHSSMLSIFDDNDDIPHAARVDSLTEELNPTDLMNESSIHIGSALHDEFDDVPMRDSTADIPCQSETAALQEQFEARVDVVDDEGELMDEWKREKLIFTGRLIFDDEQYEDELEGLDEFHKRVEAFIRRVRMGFCVSS